ncbi:MAG: aquaporin Z [Planctomycetota bacterium]|nr:aquaporin Z [Planctomycetota bacterium]
MQKKLAAEFLGTLWLVLGGCGTAILAGSTVGWVGVSIAFGLTVVSMAYAIGHISGCHLNPAVTVGLAAAGRHPKGEVLGYVIAQTLGAIAGAGVIYLIASGAYGGYEADGFASNGFREQSPERYGLKAALVCEVVMTFFFLLVIIGATSKAATPAMAGLAIGLCLTLIHLISIPITNTSVNPARSTGPALIAGGAYLGQLWLFWVAPLVGAVAAGIVHKMLLSGDDEA